MAALSKNQIEMFNSMPLGVWKAFSTSRRFTMSTLGGLMSAGLFEAVRIERPASINDANVLDGKVVMRLRPIRKSVHGSYEYPDYIKRIKDVPYVQPAEDTRLAELEKRIAELTDMLKKSLSSPKPPAES